MITALVWIGVFVVAVLVVMEGAIVLGKTITRADEQAGITREQQDAAQIAWLEHQHWGRR